MIEQRGIIRLTRGDKFVLLLSESFVCRRQSAMYVINSSTDFLDAQGIREAKIHERWDGTFAVWVMSDSTSSSETVSEVGKGRSID